MLNSHVFISYCHENEVQVQHLREELKAAGIATWWDKNISPGYNWELEINQAIERSYAFLLCLSKEMSNRNSCGVYPELFDAISKYKKNKPGQPFIFPIRLSECEIPPIKIYENCMLDKLQHIDLFQPSTRRVELNRLITELTNRSKANDVSPPAINYFSNDQISQRDRGLSKYISRMRSRAEHIPLLFRFGPKAFTTVDIYVDIYLGEAYEGNQWLPQKTATLRRVLEMEHNRWILMGEPGSGKSTLLKAETLNLLEDSDNIPVLLSVSELLQYGGLKKTLEAIFDIECRRLIRSYILRSKAIFFIDGFDEVTDVESAVRVINDISYEIDMCRLIVAGRDISFRTDSNPLGSSFGALILHPLSEHSATKLLSVRLQEKHTVKATLSRLNHSKLLDFKRNPLMLTLVAWLVHYGHDPNELPLKRVDLFELTSYALTDPKYRPPDAPRFSNPALARKALGDLAVAMHGTPGEALPIDKAVNALDRIGLNDIKGFFKEAEYVTGILYQRLGVKNDYIVFPHRMLREFLAATSVCRIIMDKGVESTQIMNLLEKASESPQVWSEVLALSCGLLSKKNKDDETKTNNASELILWSDTANEKLALRVLADAEGIPNDTVWQVLKFNRKRSSWPERIKLLKRLPSVLDDIESTVRLIKRFCEMTTHGAELWHARLLLLEIGKTENSHIDNDSQEARKEALILADQILGPSNDRGKNRKLALVYLSSEYKWLTQQPGNIQIEGNTESITLYKKYTISYLPVSVQLYSFFDPEYICDYGINKDDPIQMKLPVSKISWYEALAFTTWLGQTFRLPTVAELNISRKGKIPYRVKSERVVNEWCCAQSFPQIDMNVLIHGGIGHNPQHYFYFLEREGGTEKLKKTMFRAFSKPMGFNDLSGFRLVLTKPFKEDDSQ